MQVLVASRVLLAVAIVYENASVRRLQPKQRVLVQLRLVEDRPYRLDIDNDRQKADLVQLAVPHPAADPKGFELLEAVREPGGLEPDGAAPVVADGPLIFRVANAVLAHLVLVVEIRVVARIEHHRDDKFVHVVVKPIMVHPIFDRHRFVELLVSRHVRSADQLQQLCVGDHLLAEIFDGGQPVIHLLDHQADEVAGVISGSLLA